MNLERFVSFLNDEGWSNAMSAELLTYCPR